MTKLTELLYALAGARDDDALAAAQELVAEEWDEALPLLRRHGLAAQLAHIARAAGPEARLSQEARWQLRSEEEGARIWRTLQEREAGQVLQALDAAGIRHILMKGLAISRTTYEAPHLRVMADSDILIPKERAEEAVEIVRGMGYGILEAWHPYHHIPELYKPNRHPLELHLESVYIPAPAPLYRPVNVPFERIAERATRVPFGGTETLVPCPRDLLVQLCCNFVADFEIPKGHPLRWVRDFAELILRSDPPIDWEALPEFLAEMDPELEQYVALTLALCRPFVGHLYEGPVARFVERLPARYGAFVRTLGPERLTAGSGLDPFSVFRLLSLLMGRGNAVRWALGKVFISREHVIRQTQRSRKSLGVRFYPAAFLLHLKHHLLDGGGTPPRMPPPAH